MLSAYLLVGIVLKPQGVLGQVKVRPVTDDPERFYDLEYVYFNQGKDYIQLPVHEVRVHQGFVYCTLDDTSTREQAEQQRGMELYIAREQAVPLEEDSHFIVDLVGCKVQNLQGEPVGTLVEVLQPGAADVYVIKTPKGNMLVPALKRVVVRVDIQQKLITLDERVLPEVAVVED